MADSDSHDPRMVARLIHLERQNRRLWWTLLVLAVFAFGALTGIAVAAAREPSVVEARQFVLKDTDGEKRGELVIDSEGGHLILYGRTGEIVGELPMRVRGFPIVGHAPGCRTERRRTTSGCS